VSGISGMSARPLYECTGCGGDFASLRLFDLHRLGKHPQTGPADYLDRLRAGLVDCEDDWRPTVEFGRRCLDAGEMEARGWVKNERGRWADPVEVQRARRSFQKAVSEPRQSDLRAA
jgi:hypothetical protein